MELVSFLTTVSLFWVSTISAATEGFFLTTLAVESSFTASVFSTLAGLVGFIGFLVDLASIISFETVVVVLE